MKKITHDVRFLGTDPVYLFATKGKRVSFLPNATTTHIPDEDWIALKEKESVKFLIDENELVYIKENTIEEKVLKDLVGDEAEDGGTISKQPGMYDSKKATIISDKNDVKVIDMSYVESLEDKTQIQEYASGFGYKVPKTMSRENMIAKIKELAV